MTHPIVAQVHEVSVAYRDALVLNRVTYGVCAGTITGIIGPNGAGKSTLLKAMVGLVPVLAGRTTFFDQPLAAVRRRVGYMPQASAVDWDFPITVRDVVRMGALHAHGWRSRLSPAQRITADGALERVGLSDHARTQIGQLSGGQRQRVFLARALAQQADIYLMDEPLAAVDVASSIVIVETLRELRDAGTSIVLVHHDVETVRRLCDRVLLLNCHIVAAGEPQDVMSAENLNATYCCELRTDHGHLGEDGHAHPQDTDCHHPAESAPSGTSQGSR